MSPVEKLACIIFGMLLGGMLVFCLSILAEAVELHISGSISGSGNQSLFFAGDNVSAFWNGTSLNVTAVST